MLMTSFSGCSKGNENAESSRTEKEISKAEQLFQCREIAQLQYETGVPYMEYYNGQLYIMESEEDGSVTIKTCDSKGAGKECFSYMPVGENSGVSDFCINNEGNFVLSVRSGSNPDMEPEYDNADFDWNEYYNGFVYTHTLDTLSKDGSLISSKECDASGIIRIDGNGDYIIASNSLIDENIILRINSDGYSEVIPDTQLGSITDLEKTADGSLILLGQNEGVSVLKKWDSDKGVFTDLSIPQLEGMFLHGIITGISEDIPYYVYSDEGIYAVSSEGTVSETADSLDSGLPNLSGCSLFCTGGNIFTGLIYGGKNGAYLAEISPDTEEKPEAEILTLGCYYSDTDLSEAVSEYNRSQNEYKIQLKKYSEYDDSDTDISKSLLRLNEDISAGTAPDIIVLWGDHTSLSENGGLMNLYDLMGTNGTYKKEDFLPNYLKATESNGGLYWIEPCFMINTLFANTNLTGGKTSWTTSEFLEICRKCDSKDIDIMGYQKKEYFMELVMTGDRFIDYEKGECSFDSPDFLEALRFASEMEETVIPDYQNMTEEESNAANYEHSLRYPNGQQLVYNDNFIYMLNDYYMCLAMSGKNPSAMVGYPTADGTPGNFFSYTNEQYAISSCCKHPEAAWQFINEQLKTDTSIPLGFSVVDELLRESLKKDMELQNSYTDILGVNGVDIDYPVITQNDIDSLYNIILSIDKIPVRNEAVIKICSEVLQKFYDGTKTPEQTADELQERVSLYLKENQ